MRFEDFFEDRYFLPINCQVFNANQKSKSFFLFFIDQLFTISIISFETGSVDMAGGTRAEAVRIALSKASIALSMPSYVSFCN